MGDLIDLEIFRKKKKSDAGDEDFEELCDRLDKLIEEIDIQYKLEFGSDVSQLPGQHDISELEMNPILSALYNSYYALLFEGREDLAELQLGIIKMV
tara:strand:- start:109 stop:399 length:291 start_codon:yes stop_codon:yes gene_type:complete